MQTSRRKQPRHAVVQVLAQNPSRPRPLARNRKSRKHRLARPLRAVAPLPVRHHRPVYRQRVTTSLQRATARVRPYSPKRLKQRATSRSKDRRPASKDQRAASKKKGWRATTGVRPYKPVLVRHQHKSHDKLLSSARVGPFKRSEPSIPVVHRCNPRQRRRVLAVSHSNVLLNMDSMRRPRHIQAATGQAARHVQELLTRPVAMAQTGSVYKNGAPPR